MDPDDRRYQHPPSSGPPHLPMPRYPRDAPASYDRQRAYPPGPPPFDPRYPDQRPLSNAPSSLPAPPAPPNSAPPHLPRIQDGLYDRPPSSLPAAPPTVDYPNVSPLNGSPLDHPPLSAAPEYRPGPFHSPHQQPNGEPSPYAAAAAHYPAHPAHFPDYYSNHAIARSQRKPARAQQACDQCRARKAKCDEGRPNCSHCKENSLVCIYKDNPPHRQEKSTQLLLDRVDRLQNALDRMAEVQGFNADRTDSKLDLMLGKQDLVHNVVRDRADDIVKIQTDHGLRMESIVLTGRGSKLPKVEGIRPAQKQGENSSLKQEDRAATIGASSGPPPANEGEKDTAQHDDPCWLHTIPVEHSTAAHKLLGWRWIKYVLSPDKYDEDYVMELEEGRGLIRVYGRGEGDDASEDVGPDGAQGYPDVTLPDNNYEKTAGIESGFLTTDPETVRRYHKRYLEHMHRLHPFLHQIDLEAMVEFFINAYCPKGPASPPMMGSGNAGPQSRGVKRKRPDRPAARRVERSIDNAIVLLVLAVGSICDRRDKPLPWLDSHTRGVDHNSAASQPFSPATGPSSFSSTSTIRSGPEPRRPRNLDVVPGLAYYAYATDILGNLQGGVRLPHAQAALLAGIYAGQLAHPFQSHGWIFQAARACQVLLRPKRYMQLKDGPEKDLYLFNYWTCFQLESDLLAELDLPDSGISRMESRMTLPTGQYTLKALNVPGENDPDNYIMMLLYSAQIHLRKILNRIHTDLYTVAKRSLEGENLHEILGLTLTQWRVTLPADVQWNDEDPPAEDINIARLRAKYYGARYLIYRPVLYHYLEIFPPSDKADPSPTLVDLRLKNYIDHRSRSTSATDKESPFAQLPPEAQKACRTCINSAIQSTRAFDGVRGGRPVVTNIFGTGHAQFGNMLVLSATYVSPFGELVNRDDLDRLLRRTINFLERSQKVSPTLRKDAEILRKTYYKIFHTEPASFSS